MANTRKKPSRSPSIETQLDDDPNLVLIAKTNAWQVHRMLDTETGVTVYVALGTSSGSIAIGLDPYVDGDASPSRKESRETEQLERLLMDESLPAVARAALEAQLSRLK